VATIAGSAGTTWTRRASVYGRRFASTGAVGPALVLIILFFIYVAVGTDVLTTDEFNTLANEAAPVAIAAAGETLIVLVGGFDLSVGAVLSLINVVIATQIGTSQGSQLLMVPLALAIGLGTGLVNGLLVNFVKIPSIVATLAMSFFWGGIALLVLKQPGGAVPLDFVGWFSGNIGTSVPAVLVLILVVIVLWLLLKRTRLGQAIYAVGGDPAAAATNGVRVRLTSLIAYSLGGLLYGLAGIVLTAQSASGDPHLGDPLLLPVFAAVVIGGTVFGGGKGDLVGGIIGAYILYIIADILFALGVSSFYTNIVNGLVLLVAVVVGSLTGVGQWLLRRSRRSTEERIAPPARPDEEEVTME
jgi:ribose transport system permease protein